MNKILFMTHKQHTKHQQRSTFPPVPAEIWPPLKQTLGCWERCGDQFLLDGTAAETVRREGGVERIDNHHWKQKKIWELKGTDILTPAEPRSMWEHQDRTNRRRPESQSTWNNNDHTNYNTVVTQLLLLFLGTALCVTERMTCLYIMHRLYRATLLEGAVKQCSKYKAVLFVFRPGQTVNYEEVVALTEINK